ncbi:hypothetical protein [Lysobacter gummosus]|jgi:hypothetical protein|uniref:Secreted protein n=1 Tax=Lysobacter gummosus TaxID=262324 RepID=A0ABY3X7I6_9GAMM|nr:hypothetical protein [Lysobacter gummosus]ALN91774.1 hypothetical protein LG3211_2807 [Lysobacter gummosus]UNP27444.1 hypothetical protein MOV92_12960 [Lysobacter gummosus]
MHFKSSAWPLLCSLLLGVCALLAPRPAAAQCWYDFTYTQTFYGACMSQVTQGLNNIEWVTDTMTQIEKYTTWQDQLKKQNERFEQLNVGGFQLGELTGSRVKIDDLKERSEEDGVEEVCGKGKGKSVVADEQYKICQAKQRLVNRRYNLMVQMFKDAETRDQKIADLRNNRRGLTSANDAGKLAGNTNSGVQSRASTTNDGQNYMMTMELYTSMIAALDEEMARSAQKALTHKGASQKGPFGLPPIAGKVIQGAVLKAALAGARSRDL